MTARTNSRVAGVTFLVYIAAGITSLALSGRTHATDVLSLVTSFSALVLGVTLYAITRDQDPDLALLGLICRVVEGVPGNGRSAVYFAVGSTIFCWLLLSGRMIPAALAVLGVSASALLVALLVVQRAGLFGAAVSWYSGVTWLVWLPMLVFEVTFGLLLVVKGVGEPSSHMRAA